MGWGPCQLEARVVLVRSVERPADARDVLLSSCMNSSIVSYPQRGHYGNAAWRGNTSGLPLVDLFRFVKPRFVVDPAMGSDTTGDVCREMGIDYVGLDLHSGFNLLKDNLARRLGVLKKSQAPDMVWFHPPYHDMIVYSGEVWGGRESAHPDDLSRCASPEEFISKMQYAMFNIYDALAPEGHYAVMIADHRAKGEFHSYQADLIGLGIGKLKSVVIKAQHNCMSDRRTYSGSSFIPIRHEYILLWQKERRIQSIGALAVAQTRKLSRAFFGTWKNVIDFVMRKLGGRARLSQIYAAVGECIEAPENNHVEAKVRQVLQKHFVRVGNAEYAVAA